jgi:hypothetical protein
MTLRGQDRAANDFGFRVAYAPEPPAVNRNPVNGVDIAKEWKKTARDSGPPGINAGPTTG